MAFPLPLVELLSCKTCDSFQGDMLGSTLDGYPVQGKCRRRSPDPTLTEETDPLLAIWPTVLDTDVCSFHSQETNGHNDEDFGPLIGRGDYNAFYYLSPMTTRDNGQAVIPSLYRQTFKPSEMHARAELVDVRGQRIFDFTINKAVVNYTCETCKFWKESDTTCHRKAPEPVTDTVDGVLRTLWPTTNHLDWCSLGEVDNLRSSNHNYITNTPRGYADPK